VSILHLSIFIIHNYVIYILLNVSVYLCMFSSPHSFSCVSYFLCVFILFLFRWTDKSSTTSESLQNKFRNFIFSTKIVSLFNTKYASLGHAQTKKTDDDGVAAAKMATISAPNYVLRKNGNQKICHEIIGRY